MTARFEPQVTGSHPRPRSSCAPRLRKSEIRNPKSAIRPGVVLVITLLALVLLAGLIFYVLNLGRQTNARVVTQHGADAAAAAGAGWVARSLNTVAMNNTGMAQLIVSADILDSMPLGVAFTLEDQSTFHRKLSTQRLTGAWVQEGADNLIEELAAEVELLTPVDALLNQSGFDITTMTFYDGPGGRGTIWQAIEAMDQYSQAAMQNLGPLAQLNAVKGGDLNFQLASDGGENATSGSGYGALLLPLTPTVPWQRGEFDDFHRPVTNGLLPAAVDDKTTNRGPYDTVYGWRHLIGSRRTGYYVPGETISSGTQGGKGHTPISGGAGGDQSQGGKYVRTGTTPPTAYRVYGPQRWETDRVASFARNRLWHSKFASYVNTQANAKIRYLWPLQVGDEEEKALLDPQWITDYDQALSIANQDESRIRETVFVVVEIKSKSPVNGSGYPPDGTWAFVHRWRATGARIVRLQGWHDPQTWIGAQTTKIGEFVVRDKWEYTVTFDSSIGIGAQVDQQGAPIPQPVYRTDDFVFLGVNVGEEVPIRNPFNFTSRQSLPAPIDLDRANVTWDPAARRTHLTYLAVARRNDQALLWPAKFAGGKPYPNMVALAQAQVFNNHSFDLWTQMWTAQVEAVKDYPGWLQTLDADTTSPVAALGPDEITDIQTYLHNAAALSDVAMRH